MPTDYYLKTNQHNGQKELVLCVATDSDCEKKPVPVPVPTSPPLPAAAPARPDLDNKIAREAAKEAALIAEAARKAAASVNTRGGYYEKYMKYKAKYLNLKSMI